MVAKRRLDFSKVTDGPSTLSKRLRRVERSVANNKPEMRHNSYTLNSTITAGTINVGGITGVTQGDGVSQRQGNAIKIWRIEIRGLISPRLDCYIIQGHNTTAPVLTDFANTGGGSPTFLTGAHLQDDDTNTNFTEWKHYTNYNSVSSNNNAVSPARIILKFKNGYRVKYSGNSSVPVDNPLYFVVGNGTTNDLETFLQCRIWYTDA